MWKIAEAYTNLDNVKITYIYLCLIQLSLFFVNPVWKIVEAYTNLDNVKITYIYLDVLDPVEPLLCEPNVENCGSIYYSSGHCQDHIHPRVLDPVKASPF
jgi:hypothetical protein